MNARQITLLGLFAVFPILYLRSPRKSAAALAYLRGLVMIGSTLKEFVSGLASGAVKG